MKRKRKLVILCLIVAALDVLAYVYFSARIRPVLSELAGKEAIVLMERAAGEATETLKIDPGKLLDRSYDEHGKLTILSCDTTELNRLRSAFAEKLTELLREKRYASVTLALGTVMGGEFLSGRGPEITLRLVPVSSVEVDLERSFESGGINQTLFCVSARVRMRAKVLLPFGKSCEESVDLNCPLVQILVSGEVPETYYAG